MHAVVFRGGKGREYNEGPILIFGDPQKQAILWNNTLSPQHEGKTMVTSKPFSC